VPGRLAGWQAMGSSSGGFVYVPYAMALLNNDKVYFHISELI